MAAPAASPAASSPSPPTAEATSQQPLTDVEQAVVRQVEWYFGEINMSRDFFLKGRMDQNYWVDLAVIVAFNKMKQLGVFDPARLAALLLRASVLIEVDSKRNLVRPAWAKRAVVAVSSVPSGTPASDVEALITKASTLGKPISIKSVGPESGAIWQADYAAIEDARAACESLSGQSIGTSPLRVQLVPAFDLTPIAPGAYGIPGVGPGGVPGSQIGSTFFDGSGPNSGLPMSGGYPGGMQGGVMPQMNGMAMQGPPAGGGYGYMPGGGNFSPPPGGSNGYPVGGGSGYAAGNGQAGYSPSGGGQFYMNPYGQPYDRSSMGGQQQPQGAPGARSGNSQPSREAMEAAAAAATLQAQVGIRAGNVNVSSQGRHQGPGQNVVVPGDAGQQGQRNRGANRQQPRPNQTGPVSGAHQARYQGSTGADGNSPASGARKPNSAGNGGVAPGNGQEGGLKGAGGPGQVAGGGNRKVNGGNGAAANGNAGGDGTGGNRSQKSQGAPAEGRPAGMKGKKKKSANRQASGGNTGDGDGNGGDGKKGEESRKGDNVKAARPEPNLTEMFFPPLPGAEGATSVAKIPLRASGYARTAAAAAPSPPPPIPSPVPSVDASIPDENGPQSVGTPVSTDTSSGENKDVELTAVAVEDGADKADKALVSDVSSTVSSGSQGNGVGNQSVSPGGVSSVASAGSVEEPPAVSSAAGLSYASIVRTKAKKQLRAVSPASSGGSDYPASNGSGSLKGSKNGGVSSHAGKGNGDGKNSSSGKNDQPGNSRSNGIASGEKTGGASGTDGDSGKKASAAIASAPRSVWANKPNSVLQAAAVVKPAPPKPAPTTGGASQTGQNSAQAEKSSGISNGPSTSAAAKANSATSATISSIDKVVRARSAVSSVTGGKTGTKTPMKVVNTHAVSSDGAAAGKVKAVANGVSGGTVAKGVWGQNAKIWAKDLAPPEKATAKTEP